MTRRSQDVSVIFLRDPTFAQPGAPRVGAAPAFSLLAARLRVAGRPGRLRRGPARPAGPLTSGLPRVICSFGVALLQQYRTSNLQTWPKLAYNPGCFNKQP